MSTREVTLHLDDVKYLFVAPEFDPFSSHEGDVSGIEYLKVQLRPSALRGKGRLRLVIPAANVEPDLTVKTQSALARYCRFKVCQNHSEIVAERWKGLKALQNGVVFLATCLFLSGIVEGTESLSEWLRAFLGEGLIIAGWVSLWYPVEVLLYEWWPYFRDNQIYEYIAKMDVHIEAKDK